MDLSIWWSYVIACIAIIVSPGPSVTYLVTTSMTYGRKAAFRIIPGIFAGDLSAMVLSSVGMAAIFQASEYAYNLIRLFGIAYLVYLGIRTWMSSINKNEHISSGTWISGFLMTFLNPKTIIFFASFMPQFISDDKSYGIQMLILGCTYLCIGLTNDFTYSILADRIADKLGSNIQKFVGKLGATIMIVTVIIMFLNNA